LHCNKEFEEQKDTAKYCSTSCRVMFNRNKPKKDKTISTETKLEVLYNSILEMVGKISDLPKDYQSITHVGVMKSNGEVEPMFPIKQKLRRSFENYQQLKLDCESVEVWNELKAEILASDLSSKQKALLTS
jgi:hypothetical protein